MFVSIVTKYGKKERKDRENKEFLNLYFVTGTEPFVRDSRRVHQKGRPASRSSHSCFSSSFML